MGKCQWLVTRHTRIHRRNFRFSRCRVSVYAYMYAHASRCRIYTLEYFSILLSRLSFLLSSGCFFLHSTVVSLLFLSLSLISLSLSRILYVHDRTRVHTYIDTYTHSYTETLVNTLGRFTRPTHALTPSLKPRRCSVIVYPSVSLLYITYRRTPARRSASFVNCDRSSRENSKSFVGKKSSQFRDSINASRIGDVSEEISSNRRKSRTNLKSLKRQLIPIGVSLKHYAKSTYHR